MNQAKGKSAESKGKQDAIALLKADHRQVEEWFEQFEEAESGARKQELATKICDALTVHATIEEEIFYPAFLEATDDKDIHHEAEIEESSPDDEYFGSKVKVLSEMIKHHVKEEEQPEGMFAEARDSDMELGALGEQMAARKAELEGEHDESDDSDESPQGKSGAKQDKTAGRNMKGAR